MPVNGIARREAGGAVASIPAFLCLVLLYVVTAPANHSLSVDPYYFAQIITTDHVTDVPAPRLFLWIAAMQGLYSAASLVVTDPDPFRLIGLVNAIQAALAVTLFARMLVRDFSMDQRSAWLSAGLLASSYGVWRFATEIEVYATATLICVVLLLAAFAVERDGPRRLGLRVLILAGLGGLATLVYQPIGLLAGVAIPFYLINRFPRGNVVIYCAVSGTIVIAGFATAYLLGAHAPGTDAVSFVLDAEHVPLPAPPDLMTPPKVAYALGHDLLSTNWSYGFATFSSLFSRAAPQTSFEIETYAAERAGWVVWVGIFTTPIAAVLFGAIIFTALRHPAKAELCVREATLAVWLVAHAAMMVMLSPAGAEGWILALVPLTAFAGRRLFAPAVAAGRCGLVVLLVAVFVVHNGLAGIGVVWGEDGNYLRLRGETLVRQSAPNDLIVAQDWRMEQSLHYAGRSRTLRIESPNIEKARQEIAGALAAGDRVLIIDDIAWMKSRLPELDPVLAYGISVLEDDYLGATRRVPSGDTGWHIYEITPEDVRSR